MQTCRGYRCGSRCPELQRCSVGAGSGVQVSSAGPDTGRWTDVCVSPHPAYWALELSGKHRGFSQCAEKAPTRQWPSPEKNGKEAPIKVPIRSTIYSFLLIFLAMIDRTLLLSNYLGNSFPQPNRSFLPILLWSGDSQGSHWWPCL